MDKISNTIKGKNKLNSQNAFLALIEEVKIAVDSILGRKKEPKKFSEIEINYLYNQVILLNNFQALKEKSLIQLDDLLRLYYGESKGFLNYFRNRKKLKKFEDFVLGLKAVRNDSDSYNGEFRSPSLTGNVNSYGEQDKVVKSENYVYGSFSILTHYMAQGENQHILDENDIKERAQIIMNDFANVIARTNGENEAMSKYMINMFDYEIGKKILATYLAIIFDNPEQVINTINSQTPQQAQRWDDIDGVISYRDSNSICKDAKEFERKQKDETTLSKRFVSKMIEILALTGIEPPLSLELRVLNSAKIKN